MMVQPETMTEVDARGLACPMPLLRFRQALLAMASGQWLCLVLDDEASARDILRYTDRHSLTTRADGSDRMFRLWVQK